MDPNGGRVFTVEYGKAGLMMVVMRWSIVFGMRWGGVGDRIWGPVGQNGWKVGRG
jgi:hypothetical protein